MRPALSFLLSFVASAVVAQQRTQTFEFDDAPAGLQRPPAELLAPPPRGAPAREDETASSPLRRAQLELQRGDEHFVRAMELEVHSYDTHDADVASRRRARAEAMQASATAAYQTAAGILQAALEDRSLPYSRQTGVSMWTRIYLLIRLEKHAESIELAQTFMRECRTCPHAADAAVYIAERAFSEGRLVDAQRYYQLAANIRRAPAETRAFAYYKLAWIGVNRNDTAMSLRALERAQRLGGDLLRREVRRDAIRVLVSSRPFDAQRILNAARPFAEDASGYERLIDRIEEQLRSDSRGADADALHVAR